MSSVNSGRGIVISSPIHIDREGKNLTVGSRIDPTELRRSVLFWDRINWPQINIIRISLSGDEEYLKSCNILDQIKVPMPPARGQRGGELYAQQHIAAFHALEAQEPGMWTMSEGEHSFHLEPDEEFEEGRGALVELSRAIPLPTEDVPLEDLLRFKDERHDELNALTSELDRLYVGISNANDGAFELQRAIREIDTKCADVIKVGGESKISFKLGNISIGISATLTGVMGGAGIGAKIGIPFGLPHVGAIIGGAVSTICIRPSIGNKALLTTSPYRVVSQLLNEPI